MPRVDAILNHPVYRERLSRLAELERDRVWCRHGIDHLLAVARIMWIENLERELGLDRELIYATALLHDIGRADEYETAEPHDLAGDRRAAEILGSLPADTCFSDGEVTQVRRATLGHRGAREDATALERLLFRADKASRACYACEVREGCKWPEDKMNLTVCI